MYPQPTYLPRRTGGTILYEKASGPPVLRVLRGGALAFPATNLALQLAAAQGHSHSLARADRRRVAQHAGLVGVPCHGVAASEDRERAERVEPSRGVAQLRGGAMLPAAHRRREPAFR